MDYQQPPHPSHHHEQSQQPRDQYRQRDHHVQHQQQLGDQQEQRREYLWRERLSRQMHLQALNARAATLEEEWQALQRRKVGMQQQKPMLATLIVLSSLVGMRSLPAERLFWYERARLAQDEARLGQARMCCQRDLSALQAHIESIEQELLSLTAGTSP